MAMSADARVASADRGWLGFSSDRDHARLLDIRTRYDAILCGARTVDTQPFTLQSGGERYRRLRLANGLAEEPVRVIVSPSGSLDLGAAVFNAPGGPIVVVVSTACPSTRKRKLRERADAVWEAPTGDALAEFVVTRLRNEYDAQRLLLEGGPRLNDLFFRTGWVDRLYLTVCPLIVGGVGAPGLASGPGSACLAAAFRMTYKTVERFGDEVFLELERRKKREP